ncbi:hypothetical protein N2E09_08650 [Leuconostoc citreum]|nr:hypothetical protein [Leuconostoc citreum]
MPIPDEQKWKNNRIFLKCFNKNFYEQTAMIKNENHSKLIRIQV